MTNPQLFIDIQFEKNNRSVFFNVSKNLQENSPRKKYISGIFWTSESWIKDNTCHLHRAVAALKQLGETVYRIMLVMLVTDTAQMALKVFFFRNICSGFFLLVKTIFLSFLTWIFSWKSRKLSKIQFKMKPCGPCINFYK